MSRKRVVLLAFAIVAVLAAGTWLAIDSGSSDREVPTVAIFNLVSHPILDASVDGIKKGLAERGYSGERVRIVEVNANGKMEMLNAFAQELLASDPAVIVPVSTPVTQAVAKEAGADQPIVFSTVTNPVDVGMDKRPANMTGVSDAVNYEGNLDLIQELFPGARSVGMVYNPGESNSQFGVERVKEIAATRGLTVTLATVSGPAEVSDAARSLIGRADVIYVGSDNTVVSALDAVLSVARETRTPVIASDAGSVEKGALAAISVDYERVGREAGHLVAQVLESGVAPGRLEAIVVRGDSLILNLTAAQSLGLSIPEAIRSRALRTLP